MYDLLIIGGGPAGVAAGIYASRKHLKTVLITDVFGGQSVVSEEIQNWVGTPKISGLDLAHNFEEHLRMYGGNFLEIKLGEKVTGVSGSSGNFSITTDQGSNYEAKTILVTAGSNRRKITVPGAEKFDNRGISYCASCDGPLFAGSDVVVIGGGNAGFESAAQLAAYSKSVTLIHKNAEYKADPGTVEVVLSKPNVKGILNAEILEVLGDRSVSGISYKDKISGETKTITTAGIFVEIGLVPAAGFLRGMLKLNDIGQIEIDPWNQKTSLEGIWAAGDCTNVKYHQNNIAAGDAVRALEDIYLHLHTK